MNENQSGSGNLLDTTDCLEAVSVFKGWKNFLFIIIFLCILILQASFWLVDLGLIPITSDAAASQELSSVPETIAEPNVIGEQEEILIEQPAKEAAPNEPVDPNLTVKANSSDISFLLASETDIETPDNESGDESSKNDFLFGITFDNIVWVIHVANAILMLAAILYCLTMLFSLKVSMLGRLGGINHITRAFFLSLLMLILLLPWQEVFGNTLIGAIFTSDELIKGYSEKTSDMLDMILYYMRFSGYMILTFLLLLMSQMRSGRWARAILRRLEII